MQVSELLKERAKTHGSFTDQAKDCQSIMGMICRNPGYHGQSPVVKEGLHMLAHKMSRLSAGKIDEVDTYRDIAGYATLIVNDLEGRDANNCGE